MQNRYFALLSAAVLLMAFQTPSQAEDRIQKFVNNEGRLVYTNMMNDAAAAPAGSAERAAEVQAHPYGELVQSISVNHGVDPLLVLAVMKTESNFKRTAVSGKGAKGLMQLVPATGRRFGVRNFFDPRQNIEGGVRYLKFLLDKFGGNIELTLAAYNAGESLVERLGRVPRIRETINYVRKILEVYRKPSAQAPPSPEATAAVEPSQQPPSAAPQAEGRVYRTVDSRGVLHFSNVGPPN